MSDKIINEIRSFSRFYTNILGLNEKYFLNSIYKLAEVRIMYEVNARDGITARDLNDILKIDKGYLSRILKKLEDKNILYKRTSKKDRRCSFIHLTDQGVNEFRTLNQASSSQIGAITKELNSDDLSQLVDHMNSIKYILTKNSIL